MYSWHVEHNHSTLCMHTNLFLQVATYIFIITIHLKKKKLESPHLVQSQIYMKTQSISEATRGLLKEF